MTPRRRAPLILLSLTLVGGLLVGSGAPARAADDTATSTTTTAKARKFPLIAPGGLRPILKRERRRAEPTTTTTTTVAPVATVATTPPRSEPYFVATLQRTFVDPTRSTPSRGNGGADERAIDTTIYYPTTIAPTDQNPKPRVATGPWPLIVFAHGYAIDAAAYAPLLEDLAAGGYVVAAPDFPGTSTAYPGGAVRSDSLQQPGDISFVITEMLEASATPGLFFGAIDPNAVGDSGQSDGGVTAAAAAFNTCCIDPRIKASVILTGGSFGFDGEWFPPGTPPVMFVHATADEVNPYSASTSMFSQAQSPKYLFTIEGGSHLEVYVDPPWEPHVAVAMTAFFDLFLKGDATAADRLTVAGTEPGYSLQSG